MRKKISQVLNFDDKNIISEVILELRLAEKPRVSRQAWLLAGVREKEEYLFVHTMATHFIFTELRKAAGLPPCTCKEAEAARTKVSFMKKNM